MMNQELDRAFALEQFHDYLELEAGHSANTVENYLRDLRRLARYAVTRGVSNPGAVNRKLLREFVYALKDLGLSPATIRRQVSATRTYFGFLIGEGIVREDPSDRLESPRRGRVRDSSRISPSSLRVSIRLTSRGLALAYSPGTTIYMQRIRSLSLTCSASSWTANAPRIAELTNLSLPKMAPIGDFGYNRK